MAKATPQYMRSLGFVYEMFSSLLESEGEFYSFLQEAIDDIVAEVKEAIGTSAYDDAANASDVKRLEAYLAAAELWERKGNIALRDGVVSGERPASATLPETVKARQYRALAEGIIDRLQGRPGAAHSVEKSSHFIQDA
ncbi:MAG: hypothetical protein ACE5GY_09830 [Thermodesulfobacteriota bacterium]